ncbi:MAG TPA: hypothetical protein IGS53_18025 [Leptolyngbyaceae cyanobacterium M33_DOE_097]|uniref:Uncharacterized protein n=1 Tax=Oscillatoriales cyanobacterium SpSt-418 TaxID=2282169 RepID=A0A7C3KI39_9CYAN|nr:hypothetical protein [Leptolyngbyaceae cyanobacterium M33_DOE_097]
MKDKNAFNRFGTFAGLLTAIATTALISACDTNQPQATTPAENNNVKTEEVASNTQQYIGKVVTIRSEPIQKLDQNSFTVSSEQFFGRDPIVVINATGQPIILPSESDQEVQVTGEVRNLVIAEVERDYNLGLQSGIYREYENRPAIIARSVALAPDPGEITQDPQQYYGKVLAVTGEVKDFQNANVFELEEDKLIGGGDLLVIRANSRTGAPTTGQGTTQGVINNGEKVAVTGVLRPFVVADLEREYKLTLTPEVRQRLEAEYRQKPVLIADQVYPSAIPD